MKGNFALYNAILPLHSSAPTLPQKSVCVVDIYVIRARIAYMNYTKKLRIFNILNLFCVVYIYRYFSVVCRAMGFGFGQARCCAEFGQGDGDILMSNLQCTGSEASLSECPFDGWGVHQCSHEEDAGVFCHNQTPPTQTVTILDKTTTTRSGPGTVKPVFKTT